MKRRFNMPADDSPNIADGTYTAEVKNVEEKEGRDSGKPYLLWKFSLPDLQQNIFFVTSLQTQALWNLKRTLKALQRPHTGEIEVDFDELRGLRCLVEIENEEQGGETRPTVRNVHEHPDGATIPQDEVPF